MTYSGPDAGIIKQWEAKVVRWAGEGRRRDEILAQMTAANWRYADADQLFRKAVGREKRKWIIIMSICGFLAALGLVSIAVLVMNPRAGGVFYLPIGGIVGFIYALMKFIKIKA